MIIFPAIDIKNGKVVRLLQGDFDKVTEYGHDPVETAQHWKNEGAAWLHVVDLDGAKTGHPQNTETIIRIAASISIPVQTGGGIRSESDIERLIKGGVRRVVLGTKAIEDLDFLKHVLKKWPGQIAVSLDCKNGRVAQRGWTEVTEQTAADFAVELEKLGLQCLIYTDISRDGMLSGPNFEALGQLLELTCIPVIASGGIANLSDLKKLISLESRGLIGAITGKALYEGTLNLKEALKLC